MFKFSITSLILVLLVSMFAVFAAPNQSEATNRGGLFQRQGLFQQRNRVQNVRVQKVVAPVHVQRVQVQQVNKFVPVQQFKQVQRVQVQKVQNFGHHHHVQQFRVIEQIPVRTTRIVEVPGFNRVQKLNVVRDHHGRVLNVERVQVQQFNQNLKRSRLQGNKIIIQQNLRY